MSNRVITWLACGLLIVAGVGGGFYYYQYKSKQMVIDLIAQFAPVMDVSFSELNVDLEGRIELKAVQLAPIGYRDNVLIDKVEILSGSALSLFGAHKWFKGELPRQIELRFSNIIFDLDADFMSEQSNRNSLNSNEKTLWALACTNETNFTSLARQLGLAKLQMDVKINLQFDPSGRVFKSTLESSVPGLVEAVFQFELNSKVPFDFYDRGMLSRASITHAAINVTDTGFNLKRVKYCAKQEGIKEAAYSDFFQANVKLKMLERQTGELPELEESVLAFFKPRVNVKLRLKPVDALSLPAAFSQKFDVYRAKGLTLLVNNKVVSLDYLPLLKGHSVAVLNEQEEREEILSELKETHVKRLAGQRVGMFRSVSFAELADLQGKKIRLKTIVGKEIEGVLVQVNEDQLVVRRRVEQGIVTYPVRKSNITSIKVSR